MQSRPALLLLCVVCACIASGGAIAKIFEREDDLPYFAGQDSRFRLKPSEAAGDPPGFVRAVAKQMWPPGWPPDAPRDEGTVHLSFTVLPSGKVTDVYPLDAVGVEGFRRHAVAGLKRSRFTPATYDGKPVAQNISFTLRFGSSNPVYWEPHPAVVTLFERGLALIEDGKPQEALTSIRALEKNATLHLIDTSLLAYAAAEAYFAIADYERARIYYRRLLRLDKENEWLAIDRARFARAFSHLLRSELRSGHRMDAKMTAEAVLQAFPDNEALIKEASETTATLDAAFASGASSTLTIVLPHLEESPRPGTLPYTHRLSNRTIGFADANAGFDEFKIVCDIETVSGKVENGRKIGVPDSWTPCDLRVFGKPGANVTLIELR